MDLKRFISPVLILGFFILFSLSRGQESSRQAGPVVPTEQDIEWIKANAVPIATADPIDRDSDLMPLKGMIGNRRIVALGESTHGTSEFFKMKHRITKFLAREMGFTIFAIEANMPEARAVNRYILTGEGEAHQVLASLYFWTWNTTEVLDMIKWMREYNRSGKGKIEFYGFDIQTPTVAMECVTQFVKKADKDFLKTTVENFKKVAIVHKTSKESNDTDYLKIDYSGWYDPAKEVYDHLVANRDTYLKSFSASEVDWVIQDALVILQGAESEMNGKRSRDRSMADNLEWILKHNPGAKVVTWAHNDHVSKHITSFTSMGDYLNQRCGDNMFVFGFAFHEGTYTAVGKNGIDVYTTSPSAPGSVEWFLKSAGIPMFIIDIRSALKGEPGSQWLNQELGFRSIGAISEPYGFVPRNITKDFDAIIFFEKTSPSNCFKRKAFISKGD